MAKWEAETIIRFDEDSDIAIVYTACKAKAEMLIKRGITPKSVTKVKGGKEEDSWTFELPKWAVALKPGKHKINIGGSKKAKDILSGVSTADTE